MASNNPFSKAKGTYDLVKKAKAIQKELKEKRKELELLGMR